MTSFGRLEKAFRRAPPLTGATGQPPELRLERWAGRGTEELHDPQLAARLAAELRRGWARSVDRERAPEEESAAGGGNR